MSEVQNVAGAGAGHLSNHEERSLRSKTQTKTANGANDETSTLRQACEDIVNTGLKKQVSFKNPSSSSNNTQNTINNNTSNRLQRSNSDFADGAIGEEDDDASEPSMLSNVINMVTSFGGPDSGPELQNLSSDYFGSMMGTIDVEVNETDDGNNDISSVQSSPRQQAIYGFEELEIENNRKKMNDKEDEEKDEPSPKKLLRKRSSISELLTECSAHFGTGDALDEEDNNETKEEEDDEEEEEEPPQPVTRGKSISEMLTECSHHFGTGDCFDDDDEVKASPSPDRKRVKKSHSKILDFVETPLFVTRSESAFMADGGLGIDEDCEQEGDGQVEEFDPKILSKTDSFLKAVQTPILRGNTEDYALADGGLGVDDDCSEDESVPRGIGNLAKGVGKLVRSLSGFSKIQELDVYIGGDDNNDESSEVSSVVGN